MFTPELVNKHQHLVLNDSMLLMETQPLALFRERNETPFIFKLNFARRTWYELVDEQADILVRAHPRAPKKSSIQIESSDKLKCSVLNNKERMKKETVNSIVIEWSFSMKQCAKCLSPVCIVIIWFQVVSGNLRTVSEKAVSSLCIQRNIRKMFDAKWKREI